MIKPEGSAADDAYQTIVDIVSDCQSAKELIETFKRQTWLRSNEPKILESQARLKQLRGALVAYVREIEPERLLDFIARQLDVHSENYIERARAVGNDWRTTARNLGAADGAEQAATLVRLIIELITPEDL